MDRIADGTAHEGARILFGVLLFMAVLLGGAFAAGWLVGERRAATHCKSLIDTIQTIHRETRT